MEVNFKVPAHAAMMAGVLMKRKVLRNLCKNGTINLNTDQIDGKIAVFYAKFAKCYGKDRWVKINKGVSYGTISCNCGG